MISRGTFQPQSFCEIPVSFHAEIHAACWLQRYSFTQVQGYFVKCFLRADILLYTLFKALHSQRTNCFSSVLLTEKENPSFDSACAISQCLVNGTNCPAFLSFSPSCQSSKSLKSFSLTKVVLQTLSVMQQTLSELSFHFPNMFSNSYFLQERKDCHFHCWQHSLKKKRFQKTFGSLLVLSSPCNSGYAFVPFSCFDSILCIFKPNCTLGTRQILL